MDATKQHSCNECRRRKLRCSRDLPTCVSCSKFNRHCLYNRHSHSPLTRKHLTQVEEELRVATELLRALSPELDIHSILANVKNGFSVWEIPELGRLRQNRQDPIVSDKNFQVPQLLPVAVSEDYKSTSENPRPVYSWDERDHKAIDGMAITDRSGYLGSHSSVAVISLVFGGYSWGGTLRSPVRRDNQSVSGAQVEHYLNRYFETYHVSYPIVYRPLFWAQYNQIVPRPEIGWDSLMYTMAAIGAFMGSTDPDNQDDLVLIDKAKSHLNFELLETGSISLVQTLALLSNYLQKRDKPNSGYNYLGLAVRMAMGLGLHKQTDCSENLLEQEIGRRIWWCIYVFDCGQTITFGRPLGIPCAGIDARLPLNISDTELTAASECLPSEVQEPTIYTSVRLQSLFHLLTNCIYERITSDPFPSAKELLEWDTRFIGRWKSLVPDYFQQDREVSQPFTLAHHVLHWRRKNLQIIMYRTSLLKKVFRRPGDEPLCKEEEEAAEKCLRKCSSTIQSMAALWQRKETTSRMEAWYTVFFLVPALLMPLVCLRNDPLAAQAEQWKRDILTAEQVLQRLLHICPIATKILELSKSLGADYVASADAAADLLASAGTDESPMSQLTHLHSVLWPLSFDIEQQFL
ncbi:hypothetical protein KL941_003777 [Ogataea angusta]|nr:hypothetical protein KL943_000222 [Ogataea angusta]KAG7844401.1 hypothetical protein KL941_003777 [Ogataea angusta]